MSRSNPQGRVLVIAGSDSGGGAGIQADIKTVTALGGFAMSAITAVTVQNTLGVSNVHTIPPHILREQIDAVMGDLGADAWKLGMLCTADHAREVLSAFEAHGRCAPMVLDPVMVAKGGASLLDEDAVALIREGLTPLAALVTPNAPEAEVLTGIEVRSLDDQKRAAEIIVGKLGAVAALVKGGHIESDVIHDVLLTHSGFEIFECPRIATRATHGTGCTFASAVAVHIALGEALGDAVSKARNYLLEAIRAAPGLGHGHQPLGHGWPMTRLG